jgi:NAD(P)-dependent dehydrogenase (short-subunit alcohol dehydrogenase family)
MMLRPRFDVAGRTVFITGAARGIGAGAAQRLHAAGANVALVGLEPELLEDVAGRLGARAAWFEADVTDYEALQAAVEGTIARFGAIDVAIANAGIQFMGRMATMPREHFERTLEVNLMGAWRTDRAVLDEIVRNR